MVSLTFIAFASAIVALGVIVYKIAQERKVRLQQEELRRAKGAMDSEGPLPAHQAKASKRRMHPSMSAHYQ